MNRQAKRAMAKQEKAPADRAARAKAAAAKRPAPQEKGKRVGARQFLREVRAELRKVDWPSRQELVAYTVVVLVSVVVLTSFVFGLDYFFSKVVLKIFGA